MALVDRTINRSWGSYVEKILVRTDVQHRRKSHHLATAFLLAKFLGIPATARGSYQADIANIANRLVASGFEKANNRDFLIFEMTYLYEKEVLNRQPAKTSWP